MTLATERLFAAHNLTPKSSWQTENMSTALNMVSRTMSFTMMPEAGAKVSLLPGNLELFSVSHSEELFSFAAVYRKDFVLNRKIHVLLDLAQKIFVDPAHHPGGP